MKKGAFTFVDLFAGIGGFHAALTDEGGELVLACEIDEKARAVYRVNWLSELDEDRIQDIFARDVRDLSEGSCKEVPEHDVLVAGFPCQPFSKSGKQQGVHEERGQLFFNILKIIRKRRPQFVILENVRNLAGPRHRDSYEEMLQHLRGCGYVVNNEPLIISPHKIKGEFGGTPQHRERLFIVGVRLAKDSRDESSLKTATQYLKPFLTEKQGESVPQFLKKNARPLSRGEGRTLELDPDKQDALQVWQDFLDLFHQHSRDERLPSLPLWSEFWKERKDLRIASTVPSWKKRFIEENAAFYMRNRKWIKPWLERSDLKRFPPSLRKFEWQAGAIRHIDKCLVQFRPSGVRVKRPNYTPAMVAIGQAPVLPKRRRSISVDEARALQGFPLSFSFEDQKKSQSFKQIGNAVHPGVVQVVWAIAQDMADDLGVGHWQGPEKAASG